MSRNRPQEWRNSFEKQTSYIIERHIEKCKIIQSFYFLSYDKLMRVNSLFDGTITDISRLDSIVENIKMYYDILLRETKLNTALYAGSFNAITEGKISIFINQSDLLRIFEKFKNKMICKSFQPIEFYINRHVAPANSVNVIINQGTAIYITKELGTYVNRYFITFLPHSYFETVVDNEYYIKSNAPQHLFNYYINEYNVYIKNWERLPNVDKRSVKRLSLLEYIKFNQEISTSLKPEGLKSSIYNITNTNISTQTSSNEDVTDFLNNFTEFDS